MELRLRKLENSKSKLTKLKNEHLSRVEEKERVGRQLSQYADFEGKIARAAQDKRLLTVDVELLQKKLHIFKIEEEDLKDSQKTLQTKLMPLKSQAAFTNTFKNPDTEQPKDQTLSIKQSYFHHLASQRRQLENEIEAKMTQLDVKKRQLSIQTDAISKLKTNIHSHTLTLTNMDSEYLLEKTDLMRWDKLVDERSFENQSTENSLSLTSYLSTSQTPSMTGIFIRRTIENNVSGEEERTQATARAPKG